MSRSGWGTPERFVLWGGRVGRDAWVGSMWDVMAQEELRRRELVRRTYRKMAEQMELMREGFIQMGKRADAAMAALGKAMRAGGVLPPEV